MRDKVCYVSLAERERLTKEGSLKETYHLCLDLSNTDISYSVGDCLAIYPENDPQLVEQVLSHFTEEPTTLVTEDLTFKDYLTFHANLLKAPSKLCEKLGRADYLLQLLPCPLSAKEFCASLSPLLPRFYSIASSMHTVGKRADLTVTINEQPDGCPTKFGTCSHYLCHRATPGHSKIALYHHVSKNFSLPEPSCDKPIIMVGPGTGVAPFRGFMQERVAKNCCSDNWLFFGEQRRQYDFYYQSEWESYMAKGQLRLDVAFSRDGEKKVYVQDLMKETQEEIWQWLERGAYFFVCGDAKNMAKDVEATLCQIIKNHSTVDPKIYIKNLKSQNRYLRDVY